MRLPFVDFRQQRFRGFAAGFRVPCAVLLMLASATRSEGLTINPLYPAGTLFSATIDPVAKAAIDAAAADLSAAITTSLNAVTTDAYAGSSGGANVSLGFQFTYADPFTNAQTVIPNATIAANAVNIFIGARNLAGKTLGVASPGFVQVDISQFSGGGSTGGWLGAVAIAESKAQTAYKRGSSTVVETARGNASLGTVTATLAVDFGFTYGSLAFDWDSNNDELRDSEAQLNDYWHFDHTTLGVPAQKNDFYSVALHELIHTLGIGTTTTWNSLVSGTSWSGSEVLALTGSGANLINPAGDHLREGLMSRRITDGTPQEVALDPTITLGKRKLLTELDLAFLRDLGHSTILPNFPTQPGDFDRDGDVDGTDLARWRNNFASNALADADQDADSDGQDFLLWQRNYTGSTTFVAVPEPTTWVLLLPLVALGLLTRASIPAGHSAGWWYHF